ncbi:hypothetical protein ACFO4E_24000 [Nocardiopsis mangrovi]|uniref:NB-ARC domain-containing protein n=1 Tax=Nocardiopsis mangrovi TaxID=1179818 RepID=A0ABV9E418_9ACTN
MSDPVTPDPLPPGVRNSAHSADSVVQANSIAGGVTIVNNHGGGPRPPHRPTVPGEVPDPPSRWHNRVAELEAVRRAVRPPDGREPGARITVVGGARGMGKSALVHRFAAETVREFDGGQLYVDYERLDPEGSAGPGEALGELLGSLGLPKEDMKAGLHGRAAQFRTVTRDRRLLVVVDGATQAAQVRELIPHGPQSAVLAVGSRARLGELTLDHAEWLTLPPLEPREAGELFTKQCGHKLGDDLDQESLASVVAACEGLPLALVIAAGRLRPGSGSRSGLSVLAAELTDERRRLTSLSLTDDVTLTTVFNVAYDGLTAEAAALYRALGCWPGSAFDLALAATAGRGEPGAVADLLAALSRAELIAEADTEGRFRFAHGLLRLHAADLALEHDGAETRDTVLTDCLDAYAATLAHADAAVMGPRLRTVDLTAVTAGVPDPFGGDRGRALRWLNAERDTILIAVRVAVRRGLDTRAYRIAELATALYLNHRYLADWVETGTQGADAARRQGAGAAEARLRSLVSRPLTDLGRTDDAREQLERALHLVRDEDDLLLAASVHEFHGRFANTVDKHAALDAFARARRLNERSHHPQAPRGLALARYFAGHTWLELPDPGRAIAELEDAVAAFEALEPADLRMAARARGSLAAAYAAAGLMEDAVAACTAAVEALHARDNPYYEAENLERLGLFRADMEQTGEAREHWSRARDLFAEMNSPRAARVQARIDALD